MRVADRIVLLNKGEVKAVGRAEDLYLNPPSLFVARFFTELNEIPGVVRKGRVETPIGIFPAPGLAEGMAARVCIRPQGVKMRPRGLCIPARIVSRRFVGEVELVELLAPGLDAPIKGRLRESLPGRPGSDIGLEIDGKEVLVFAADGQ